MSTTTQAIHERYAKIVEALKASEDDLYELFRRLTTTQEELRRHGVESVYRMNSPMEACFDEWVRLNGEEPVPRDGTESELMRILG